MKRHPISQKQQFLRSKGLSENEIQIACERAGLFTGSTVIDMNGQPAGTTLPHYPAALRRPSRFRQFLDVVNSVAAVSGIAYCVYQLYIKYIRPWLFGAPKVVPKKTVDESLKELETNMERRMDELNAELIRVREEINKTSFQNIKSDLDAIKGLLLNKKQFASPIVPPSIPAWQLAAASSQLADVEAGHRDDKDDNDTGSGSSETEIVTKNSDSSLEIM